VLEYAILEHPWARRGDEAHKVLAEVYERHNDLNLAISTLDKLVLDHPNSELRPAAQAHVPELRLRLLRSPEFDRGTLLKAEAELKRWLNSWPSHELAPHVGVALGDCLRRLCDSDLSIAGYYRTVGNPFGARFHAERAIEEARDAGDEARVRFAEGVVAELPPQAGAAPAPQAGAP
jgi:outer membrane protein assembly factor BamD (BamD/ComL family)